MERVEDRTVTAVDELTTLYARPLERVLNKELDHVDEAGSSVAAGAGRCMHAGAGRHD